MATDFNQLMHSYLKHEPTDDQFRTINELLRFMMDNEALSVFLLKGYAGTGKTTLIGAFVKTMKHFGATTVLLAPTGRAAKVLGAHADHPAGTIHRQLYRVEFLGDGYSRMVLQENKFKNVVFIVDEGSMIATKGSGSGLESQHLLDDLLSYVYNGENCKLIIVGDQAQLPPVGEEESPALDPNYMQTSYSIHLYAATLKEVVRQAEESMILSNATFLRNKLINQDISLPLFHHIDGKEVKALSGYDLEDELETAYGKYSTEGVMVITRSNKNAYQYNRQIRARIRWIEEPFAVGDYLMVVRNNYFWLKEDKKVPFIANGDMMEVLRIQGYESKYGFNFVNVTVRLIDYPALKELDVKLLLDVIDSETAGLPFEKHKALYYAINEQYSYIPSKARRREAIRKDVYYQALHVKFAYAVTCHKSQGGQWDAVFVDQGYVTEELLDLNYLRWLYTAVTRAQKQLFLVNFYPAFLGQED